MSLICRSTGLPLLLLVAALAVRWAPAQDGVGVAAAKAAAKRAAAEARRADNPSDNGGDEPAAEFTLEIGGKTVDLRLGRPATVQVNGKPVKVKLTAKAKPTTKDKPVAAGGRLFKGGGVSFRYPENAELDAVLDPSGGINAWSFDTLRCSLTVEQHVNPDLTPDQLRKEAADIIVAEFGPSKCRLSDATISIGGTKVSGTRIDTSDSDGEPAVHEVYAWQARKGGDGYVILLQDTPPEKGGTSPRATEFRALLEKTFKYEGTGGKR